MCARVSEMESEHGRRQSGNVVKNGLVYLQGIHFRLNAAHQHIITPDPCSPNPTLVPFIAMLGMRVGRMDGRTEEEKKKIDKRDK